MELRNAPRDAIQPARAAHYASSVPAGVDEMLEEAMGHYRDTARAESLLTQARDAAPESLSVYFSLYKFYFYKGRLAEAEATVQAALAMAAKLGDFPADFTDLNPASCEWHRHDSPQHFYLFSLKALAFIRLRQGDTQACEAILGKLAELDSGDTIGASVIGALAAGV